MFKVFSSTHVQYLRVHRMVSRPPDSTPHLQVKRHCVLYSVHTWTFGASAGAAQSVLLVLGPTYRSKATVYIPGTLGHLREPHSPSCSCWAGKRSPCTYLDLGGICGSSTVRLIGIGQVKGHRVHTWTLGASAGAAQSILLLLGR